MFTQRSIPILILAAAMAFASTQRIAAQADSGMAAPPVVGPNVEPPVNVRAVLPDDVIPKLHKQLAELRMQEARLMAKYSDQHPELVGLRNQIMELEQQLERQATQAPVDMYVPSIPGEPHRGYGAEPQPHINQPFDGFDGTFAGPDPLVFDGFQSPPPDGASFGYLGLDDPKQWERFIKVQQDNFKSQQKFMESQLPFFQHEIERLLKDAASVEKRTETARELQDVLRRVHRLRAINLRDPQRFEREAQEQQRDLKIRRLVEQYRDTEAGNEKEALRGDLRGEVSELFDLKMETTREEARQLEAELAEIRRLLAKRQEMREQLIDRRMNEMIGEDDLFDW